MKNIFRTAALFVVAVMMSVTSHASEMRKIVCDSKDGRLKVETAYLADGTGTPVTNQSYFSMDGRRVEGGDLIKLVLWMEEGAQVGNDVRADINISMATATRTSVTSLVIRTIGDPVQSSFTGTYGYTEVNIDARAGNQAKGEITCYSQPIK
ncbi:MAG: hypothetical protein AB7G93_09845 [Bdellovibrionales bacterium]